MKSLLTTYGDECAAALLDEGVQPPVGTLPSPCQEFFVAKRGEPWTLANDVLTILSGRVGVSVEPAGQSCQFIAAWLLGYMGLPLPVGEEILRELTARGMLEATLPDADYEVEWLAGAAHLLGHKSRLELLIAMGSGPKTSIDLRQALGGVHVMTMRNHLHPLVEAEFVVENRMGKVIDYSVMQPMLEVFIRRYQRHITGGSA